MKLKLAFGKNKNKPAPADTTDETPAPAEENTTPAPAEETPEPTESAPTEESTAPAEETTETATAAPDPVELRSAITTVANAVSDLAEQVSTIQTALETATVEVSAEDLRAAVGEGLPAAIQASSTAAAAEIVSGLGVDPEAAPAAASNEDAPMTPADAVTEYERLEKDEGGAAAETFRRANSELFKGAE